MIPYWMSRTQLLLGDELVKTLMSKHVLVVGLGGVGGICAEMIARAGVGKMTIVDADTVDLSNANRQIPALHSTAGQLKTEAMAARLKDINPELQLVIKTIYIKEELTVQLLDETVYDYAVDCIDTLSPKVFFIKSCLDRNIPIVSSLGAGGKIDPSQVVVTDIAKTYQCNLASYVRKKLHALGIYKGLTVVFSPEQVDQTKIIETEKAFPKKSIIGTISYMPAIFGCMAASVVIRGFMNEYKGIPTFHAKTRADWRNWLEKNGEKEQSVWLVIYKKESGIASVYYPEAVDEALCFGWIDSKPNKRDEQSYYQFFAKRNPKSNWSKVNKDKVERLLKEGLIEAPGLAAIEQAKKNGTWTALDEVEELIMPADLQAGFAKNKTAFENWEQFPKSVKRGILEWVLNAKRPETREKRINELVSKAAENIRVLFEK